MKNQPPAKKKANADSLMRESVSKKRIASEQEKLGKAQIKNKVKVGQTGTLGDYTGKIKDAGKKVPVGQERIDIAKRLRKEATADSLAAVNSKKGMRVPSAPKTPSPRKSKK